MSGASFIFFCLVLILLNLAIFWFSREQARIARNTLRREAILLLLLKAVDEGIDARQLRAVYMLEHRRQHEHRDDWRLPPQPGIAWPEDR